MWRNWFKWLCKKKPIKEKEFVITAVPCRGIGGITRYVTAVHDIVHNEIHPFHKVVHFSVLYHEKDALSFSNKVMANRFVSTLNKERNNIRMVNRITGFSFDASYIKFAVIRRDKKTLQ